MCMLYHCGLVHPPNVVVLVEWWGMGRCTHGELPDEPGVCGNETSQTTATALHSPSQHHSFIRPPTRQTPFPTKAKPI